MKNSTVLQEQETWDLIIEPRCRLLDLRLGELWKYRDLELWWARVRGKPNSLLKIGQEDHGNRAGETIWALKDVTFEVEQGEVLGIIGTGTLTRDVHGHGLMDGYPRQGNL